MKTSNKGIELIKSFEGCVLTAYKPVAEEAHYTIGYGHYGTDVKKGMTITQEQAEELLRKDLECFELHVSKYSETYNWNQNEFDALVSFSYNIGNIDQLTAYGTRSREGIANSIRLYNKAAGGQVLEGLVRRRQAEYDLFVTEVAENATKSKKKYNVTVDNLNCRKKASKRKGTVIGLFTKGTVVTCIHRGNVWSKVKGKSSTGKTIQGWVVNKHLK